MCNKKKFFTSIFLLLFSFSLLVSCRDDDNMGTDPALTEYSYIGNFQSSAHPTSGVAKISKNNDQLGFENFKSDKGPDLNVYLAADINNIKGDFIDLGDVKGLSGNFLYNINSSTDISKYKYVVIWCVDFDANFGYAELKKSN